MKRQRPAFTLLELLTVIAILTLLIGILVPALSSARRQAKASACLANLKGIGTAFTVYLTENQDKFPPHQLRSAPASRDDNSEPYVNSFNRKWPRWQWFLKTEQGPPINPAPFRRLSRPWGDEGLYSPPGTPANSRTSKEGTTMTVENFSCPALDDPAFMHDERDGAYGFNYQYLGNAREETKPNERWDNFVVSMHQVPAASGTVLVADSRGAGKIHGPHSYTLDPPRLASEKNSVSFGPAADDLPQALDPTIYAYSPVEGRHKDQANVIFVDSHGEATTPKELGYEMNDSKVPHPVRLPEDGDEWDNGKWTGQGHDAKIDKRPVRLP